ncbi:clusterin-associated protein 1 [Chloropicon primus]|uniref:Clusterin-associated protein 1 n=1 Tax=Chloropicon primus TaxID=1764295 RepID=A0A5B8MMY6_9CHLO|nr:clusterin-associated protein 1 [Chloropicon primus]UPR01049.1 clusterin-associated protein 1 [Chloropicon primus]|eukprot:QDZ21829.1 clusterin-associated protein 1 [Chloropicon primus]
MSFRELRNFTETMRCLGYPRLISMENFRTPNFELVADLLYWLLKRYDPEISISDEISTESDRVLFLKSTAKIMLSKARVKLNLKRLYAADGHAVRELLKIANMLRDATTKAEAQNEAEAVEVLDLDRKSLDPKQVREHATDITRCGAFLYDVLQNEIQSRDMRYRAVNSNIDLEEIERAVQNSIQSVRENITNLDIQLDELEKDKSNLESKIEKRRAELERSEKRLSTLQSVRPAYMDEYEQLQAKMQDLYTKYLERHRNLEYLESQLELYRSKEQKEIDEASKKIRKMQRRLQDEEMRILRGEVAIEDNELDDDDITDITEDSGFLSPGAQSTLQSTRRRSIVETQLPGDLVSSAEKTVQGSLAINDDDSDEDAFSDLTEASEDSDTHLSVNDEDGLDEDDLIEEEDDADILSGDDFTTEGSDNEF